MLRRQCKRWYNTKAKYKQLNNFYRYNSMPLIDKVGRTMDANKRS